MERSTTIFSPDGKKKSVETDAVDDNNNTWKIKASFSGSSAIIVHVIQGKNAWHFCDSYWLLRDKLASIGKAIGIRKGDSAEAKAWMSERFGRTITDFEELTQSEKTIFYSELPQAILTDYNRTDCEILWKAIQQFEEEIVELGWAVAADHSLDRHDPVPPGLPEEGHLHLREAQRHLRAVLLRQQGRGHLAQRRGLPHIRHQLLVSVLP